MSHLLRSVLALDASLTQRVASGRELWKVSTAAAAVLVLGCGAYGVAMGLWRDPVQAVSAGLKLPAMFLCTAASTAALDVVLCGLLRARVRPMQALTASVSALAMLGAVLGSLAPIAAFLSLQAAPPRGAASIATSHWLLTGHVAVLGVAGILAVGRLRGMLDALIPDAAVSRRVLWAWMLTHGVVGAQMSWVLRPFVGNPTLPVHVLRPAAWQGSFFEAVYEMTVARMGLAGPACLGLTLLLAVVAVATHLDPAVERFELHRDRIELHREGASAPFSVSIAAIRDVSVEPGGVRVHWHEAGSLARNSALLPVPRGEDPGELFERIGWTTRRSPTYR